MSTKFGVRDEMKRADRRSSITILVLGDEDVGKSSLISTFVSRYFSEMVPGIMTRVRLPPDPHTSCVTTLIDSQGADTALLHNDDNPFMQKLASENSLNADINLTPTKASTAPTAETTSTVQPHSYTTGSVFGKAMDDAARVSTGDTAAINSADSIVLVYDLDRVETFYRLENHWLPLIERYYGGKVPVIVAENKMDLFHPSSSGNMQTGTIGSTEIGPGDDQALARKRQQIVALMQRFPFVRQCIKCSAKNLLRVDDVFIKAQQAILYPFVPPLYDLETGELTIECKRALTRIFRIFDKDHDGLLSDAELDRFQRDTYHVAIFDQDLAAWKKVVTRNNSSESNESVLQDGKFTVQGFLTIFDVFISQNRLDVVWQALREFNYDDDLNLHVPDTVTNPEDDAPVSLSDKSWRLSGTAKIFLTELFQQFDSDKDGMLSSDDIVSIFSILSPPCLPPWHPIRAAELFEGCFSIPKASPSSPALSDSDTHEIEVDNSLITPVANSQSLLSSSGVSILSASDSLPSIDVGVMSPLSGSLSYLEWMGHWHAIAAISPSITRAELYRIGHLEDYSKHHSATKLRRRRRSYVQRKFVEPKAAERIDGTTSDMSLRSREVRVLVFGSHGCGKTALLNALCGTFYENRRYKEIDTSTTYRPETSTTFVKMERTISMSNSSKNTKANKKEEETEEVVVHLVFTDVPETAAARQKEHYIELSELFGSDTSPLDRMCDLAMLVFDSTDPSSFLFAKELEAKLLSNETPRVFVASKTDLLRTSGPEDGVSYPASVLVDADNHCRKFDLELPWLTSASETGLSTDNAERIKALNHLSRCALLDEPGVDHLKSRPHEEKKRREAARRRKMMWLGGIVSVGVVVAVGVGLLLSGGSGKKDQKRSFGWLRSLFNGSRTTPYSQ